ncbi:MAG: lamin tail domain-containing protein, partial [Pontiellaceae bacterium]|nr:lamin tail domain-containing protein [Pontiellaceae bacterium]
FYKGVRPGSNENSLYFPMHRKGAVQMGNGGDNGNGSAGTFYEGVITFGYPTDDAVHAVQANIVAAGYDVHPVSLSRITTFTPDSSQEVTMTFRNITEEPVTVKLSLDLPEGWSAGVDGSDDTSKTFTAVEPDTNVGVTFTVTSPKTPGGGFLSGKAAMARRAPFKTPAQRLRNVRPVKINEVAVNPTDSFVELYNASDEAVDLSHWTLINTRSEWAPVTLATLPAGTQLAPKSFYVLGLADSGLSTPASAGDTTVHVRSTAGLEVGQQVGIDGEARMITAIGTPASAMTTLFIPRSTGPWLRFPAGTENLPVTSADGFEVGQKIGIDIGGNYEVATVTKVGTPATQTTLAEAVKAGATTIRVASNSNMSVGDTLTIGTGGRKETATIKSIISVSAAPAGGRRGGGTPGEVELSAPLKNDQIEGVDVSDTGTGISFAPATRFAHKSGDAVQALGSGLTLDRALAQSHAYGAPVVYSADAFNFKGAEAPNQWFGEPLSDSAGSIALMNADGQVVVDAMVYGSQQSNSSGNGTITSPELATLEGVQSQGGCIVVVPRSGRDGFGRRNAPVAGAVSKSMGRFPDGADTDSNCTDFLVQNNEDAPTPGAPNQYVREAR